MGSSGSGNFSDYSGAKGGSSGGSSSGGSSGQDRCGQAFTVSLEDISEYEYFLNNQTVPPVQTLVNLEVRGRLVAVDQNGGSIGALPTRMNYLAGCLNDGFNYAGVIQTSSLGNVPNIIIDFAPV